MKINLTEEQRRALLKVLEVTDDEFLRNDKAVGFNEKEITIIRNLWKGITYGGAEIDTKEAKRCQK